MGCKYVANAKNNILEVTTKLQKKRDLKRLIEEHTFEINKPFENGEFVLVS